MAGRKNTAQIASRYYKMILDLVEHGSFYKPLHPLFKQAFEYLQKTNFERLEDGKYPIREEAVFAILATNPPREMETARLEVHRRYIDLQYIISGEERIGWKAKEFCRQQIGDYDNEKDILFYSDPIDTWLKFTPGRFGLFFPEDAHAPGISSATVRKLVLKIAV